MSINLSAFTCRLLKTLLLACLLLISASSDILADGFRIKQSQTTADQLKVQQKKVTGTFAEAVTTGDIQVEPSTQVHLAAPATIKIHTWTSVDDAQGIGWRLDRLPLNPKAVALTGHIPNTTNTTFSLNLKQYLPPVPPKDGGVYILRTYATGKQQRANPSGLRLSTKTESKPVIPALGYLSNPVVIHYKADNGPSVAFGETQRYRRMRVVMDKFRVVTGDGEISETNEYRIKGMTQELFTQNYYPPGWPYTGEAFTLIQKSGKNRRFGILSKNIKPGDGNVESSFNTVLDPKTFKLKHEKNAIMEFDFGNTGQFTSRRFIIAATIIERDNGGKIQEWSDTFQDISDYLNSPSVIGEPLKNFQPDILKAYDDMRGEMMDIIKSALSEGTPSDPYSMTIGATKAIATFFVTALLEGMKDDFYGTRSMTLDIGSNLRDAIESQPGKPVDTEDGYGWRIGPFTWTYYGAPAAGGASSYSGVVEIDYYIEFYDIID
jgi:hypothetical protein